MRRRTSTPAASSEAAGARRAPRCLCFLSLAPVSRAAGKLTHMNYR
jgi:hypothetical protein